MMNDLPISTKESVLADLTAALNTLGYRYHVEKDGMIEFSLQGSDIPMSFEMLINDEKKIVLLYSVLPLTVTKEREKFASVAVSAVNYRLADGAFDYNEKTGMIAFRMTTSYLDSKIGVELLEYMIRSSAMTVDRYNDKLLMLSRGLLTEDEFNIEIGFTE